MASFLDGGSMKKGKLNKITDVDGLLVGHKTIQTGNHQTGVTFIRTQENIFHQKCVCGCSVLNGYGKTTGLLQIQELGTLESYICLTNTLNVGIVQQALTEIMIQENEGLTSVNVVVGECNDSYLNDIRDCVLTKQDVFDAYLDCKKEFKCGSVGAGRGMSCFEMSGGIGSSSRVFKIDEKEYTLGVLVLSNFGLREQFLVEPVCLDDSHMTEEKGSIMMIIATDAPLSDRQLRRICNRMPIALSKTGSHMGNGSGDIAIAFTTHNKVGEDNLIHVYQLSESKLNIVFDAAIDACYESIMNSLQDNERVQGNNGHIRYSLSQLKKSST